MSISPIVTINGLSSTNGQTVTAGSTVTIALQDPTGAYSWTIECWSVDKRHTAAAINATIVYPTPGIKVATFTAPNDAFGAALLFRSVVNGGIGPNGPDETLTSKFGVFCLKNAIRPVAKDQTYESDSINGWTGDFDDALQAMVAGATGPAGGAGATGPAGATGGLGPTGPRGATGVAGPGGATGPSGGPIGPTGPQGNQGATGPAGAAGAAGGVGATGPAGVAGPTGSIGPQGVAGPTGSAGPTGPRGNTGVAGPTGSIGGAGVAGPTGSVGPTGSIGPQGVAGPTGGVGPQGATGPMANQGSMPNSYAVSTGSQMPTGGSFVAIPSSILNLSLQGAADTVWDFRGMLQASGGAAGQNIVDLRWNVDGVAGPSTRAGIATGPEGLGILHKLNLSSGGHTGWVEWNKVSGPKNTSLIKGEYLALGLQQLQGVQGPTGPAGTTTSPGGNNGEVQVKNGTAFAGASTVLAGSSYVSIGTAPAANGLLRFGGSGRLIGWDAGGDRALLRADTGTGEIIYGENGTNLVTFYGYTVTLNAWTTLLLSIQGTPALTATAAGVTSYDGTAGITTDLCVVSYSNTADWTTSNTTATDTTFTVPCVTGEVWFIEIHGRFGNTAAGGLKFAIGAPVGSTVAGGGDVLGIASAATDRLYADITAINTLSSAYYTVATASGGRPGRIWATVTAGGTGSITFQLASVSGAATTRMVAGSQFMARRCTAV